MERMELLIEEIDKPVLSLKHTPFMTTSKQWNQQLRDSFMKINEKCYNFQQMESMNSFTSNKTSL